MYIRHGSISYLSSLVQPRTKKNKEQKRKIEINLDYFLLPLSTMVMLFLFMKLFGTYAPHMSVMCRVSTVGHAIDFWIVLSVTID